ncbi:hypothetical protein E3N88_29804 [Mikania micrantha]|uniref:Retrotransposon gag domain-containing protein n=1 Tax=Mikania micrantha TaxID=192012 RepID=A0A5N6MJT7_9ASTR|nr:hypothetical protein E3N88_29804 [Mikania micrantha]
MSRHQSTRSDISQLLYRNRKKKHTRGDTWKAGCLTPPPQKGKRLLQRTQNPSSPSSINRALGELFQDRKDSPEKQDRKKFRVIDDNIKALQDFQKQSAVSQSELQSEVSLIATSLEDTKKIMNKVLVRLDSLTPKEKFKHTEHGPNSSGNEGSSILGRHKPAPIYLPRFSGTHPERWVAQANRYFDFYSIDDTDRLTISSFYLDDVAADWYYLAISQIGFK